MYRSHAEAGWSWDVQERRVAKELKIIPQNSKYRYSLLLLNIF